MSKFSRATRFSLLACALTLSALAAVPVRQAEAASCGSWGYFGCCFIGSQVRQRQQRVCCTDSGSCHNETRCTSSACAV